MLWVMSAMDGAASEGVTLNGFRGHRPCRRGPFVKPVLRMPGSPLEGYPLAREYADTWKRGRPASWRFVAQLVVVVAAIPLLGQIAMERFARP